MATDEELMRFLEQENEQSMIGENKVSPEDRALLDSYYNNTEEFKEEPSLAAQAVGGTIGFLEGAVGVIHKEASEQDATAQIKDLNAREQQEFLNFATKIDPELAKNYTTLQGQLLRLPKSLSPQEMLDEYRREKVIKAEWQKLPQGKLYEIERLRLTRLQHQTPKERVVKAKLLETYLGKNKAQQMTGVTEEDLEDNKETAIASQVVGEVSALVLASKIAPKMSATKLIKKAPMIQKSLIAAQKAAPKVAKVVKSGIEMSKFFAADTAVKQIARPEPLISKTKKVGKSAGAGFLTGATFTAGGMVTKGLVKKTFNGARTTFKALGRTITDAAKNTKIGKNILDYRKETVKQAFKLKQNLAKSAQHIKGVPNSSPISESIATNVILSDGKKASNLWNYLSDVPGRFEMQGVKGFRKWQIAQKIKGIKIEDDAIKYYDKVKNLAKSSKVTGKRLNLKLSTDAILQKNFDFVKQTTKVGNKLVTKKIKLTEGEKTAAKEAKKFFDKYKTFIKTEIAKERGIPVSKVKLPDNYVKRYYKKEVVNAMHNIDNLGLSNEYAKKYLERVFNKEIDLKTVAMLRNSVPKTFQTGVLKSRKLADKAVEPFLEKDLNKLVEIASKQMARQAEFGGQLRVYRAALEQAKTAAAKNSLHIPQQNIDFIENLIKSYTPQPEGTIPFMNRALKAGFKTLGVPLNSSQPFDWVINTSMAISALGTLGGKASFAIRNVTQKTHNLFLGVPLKNLTVAQAKSSGRWLKGGKLSPRYAKYLKQSNFYKARQYATDSAPSEITSAVATGSKGLLKQTKRGLYGFIRISDRSNVEVSLFAARDYARSLKMPEKMAIQFADDIAALGQFLYNTGSRPIISRGALKPIYMFKGWSVNQLNMFLHGRAELAGKYGKYLPKNYASTEAFAGDALKYLVMQYGSIAALQTMTGLDISSADPVNSMGSIVGTGTDLLTEGLGSLPGFNNLSNPNNWYKMVPASNLIGYVTGKKDNPFGTTLKETKAWRSRRMIPRPSDLIQKTIDSRRN